MPVSVAVQCAQFGLGFGQEHHQVPWGYLQGRNYSEIMVASASLIRGPATDGFTQHAEHVKHVDQAPCPLVDFNIGSREPRYKVVLDPRLEHPERHARPKMLFDRNRKTGVQASLAMMRNPRQLDNFSPMNNMKKQFSSRHVSDLLLLPFLLISIFA